MSLLADAAFAFHAYGTEHLTVLGIIVLLIVVLVRLTRGGWERSARALEIMLAITLLLCWPVNVLVAWRLGTLNATNALPLQLCDLAAIIGGIALLSRQQELCELLYFWGLAGTLQGLITPALQVTWPQPRFVMFFILHGAVVTAAMQVVIGRGIIPKRGAVRRAMGWIVVYALVAGAVDLVLVRGFHAEVNYGFLCAKPPTASLLDALGDWPWYLLWLVAVAAVFFSLLNLPFVIRQRREGRMA
jgi:hypothetical integral membrane protein (TIGR02206 family)